ncbi:hypothetical protein [Burkholderia cenocepacia]|uniref:hypothetical protein n=1 Tax=Burkholderia cenocepacia TaxID=95486 RepID=UPI0020125CF8|nr:hypothetical protein [Burkholderia cenocepacia]
MKILVDGCMVSVDSKHHANAVLSARAVFAPLAARWISSEMPQMQHAARDAPALLEIQQNDWNAGARAASSGRCIRRQTVAGRARAPIGTPVAKPRSRTAEPQRHRFGGAAPDHTHNNASIWGYTDEIQNVERLARRIGTAGRVAVAACAATAAAAGRDRRADRRVGGRGCTGRIDQPGGSALRHDACEQRRAGR